MILPPEEKTDFHQFINTHWNKFGVQHHYWACMGFTHGTKTVSPLP